ncbi:MAG: hypothetical protein GY757_43430 [bacterium]|nr:hypothetical protein [bacterium]
MKKTKIIVVVALVFFTMALIAAPKTDNTKKGKNKIVIHMNDGQVKTVKCIEGLDKIIENSLKCLDGLEIKIDGLNELSGLEVLDDLDIKIDLKNLEKGLENLEIELKGLESLKGLEALKGLESLKALEELENIDIDIDLDGLEEVFENLGDTIEKAVEKAIKEKE